MSTESELQLLAEDQWQCDQCTYINATTDLTCVMCYTVRTSAKDQKVQWQWCADEKWIPYDLAATLQIENAFKAGKSSVSLTTGFFQSQRDTYSISFQKKNGKEQFYQTNCHSGSRRQVRRIADDDSKLFQEISKTQITQEETCGICQLPLLQDQQNNEEEEDMDIQQLIEKTRLATEKLKANAKISGTNVNANPDSATHADSNSSSSSAASSASSPLSSPRTTHTATSTASSSSSSKTRRKSKSGSSNSNNTNNSAANLASASASSASSVVKLPKCTNHYFHRACIASWLKLKDHCAVCKTRI